MKKIRYLILLILISLNANSQIDYKYNKRNGVDFLILGNRAILNIQYNRTIYFKDKISVELSPSIGYTPGSHDRDTIPSFAHFGIGSSLFFGNYNRFGIGLSYSGLMKMGEDKLKSETKKFSNAILGEISYLLWLDNEGPYLKFAYFPILLSDNDRKKNNFPIGFAIGTKF